DLSLRALRSLGELLPVQPERVPDDRRAMAFVIWRRREGHRGSAPRGLGMGTRKRLAQWTRRVPVCARLRWTSLMSETTTPRKHTEVAVGILIRQDDALLLSTRPEGKPYAGYWEFPGGKIEVGETV